MNPSRLEVLFSPAEFSALRSRNLSQTACVVFDILRATTSIITALANGAEAVVPVETIAEAVALKGQDSSVLLAGERHGLRIAAGLSGGVEFDLGNSPREFTAEKVRGRTIAITTTNGTRALKSCAHADQVLAASFLNLSATAAHLQQTRPQNLLLICSGTHEEASYEDTLAAGALAEALWPRFEPEDIADSAHIARNIYLAARPDLLAALFSARNARRLQSMPALAEDVPFCIQRDSTSIIAALIHGKVVRIS